MKKSIYSTQQAAKICNVHLTTIIKWISNGLLKAYTTPGGHRRIHEGDLVRFMKKYRMPMHDVLIDNDLKILIVDDDIETLEELKAALNDENFEIDLALNGFEAGRKIYRKKPDIVLLDFRMPGLDGFEVCKMLNKDKETADIDIIAITGIQSEKDIQKIKNSGIKAFFQKPVDIHKLKEAITELAVVTS